MAKLKKQNFDLKAAKELLEVYLRESESKKEINLPPGTVQIDNLNRKNRQFK